MLRAEPRGFALLRYKTLGFVTFHPNCQKISKKVLTLYPRGYIIKSQQRGTPQRTKGSKTMFKDYKVEFIGANGNRNYRMFDTEKEAIKHYEKCNGEAVIKKYNPETFEYEVIKDAK